MVSEEAEKIRLKLKYVSCKLVLANICFLRFDIQFSEISLMIYGRKRNSRDPNWIVVVSCLPQISWAKEFMFLPKF